MSDIGSTNVPQIQWSSGGPIVPSGPAVLAGVQQDYTIAFSVTFNWNGNTPQGQLTASTATLINNANQELAWIATQVDPAYSTGRFQDAIGRITPGPGFARLPSEPTVLQIECLGAAGVVLPAGPTSFAMLVDPSGNIYQATETTTIPSGGSVTLSFAAVVPGPTGVPGTVSIYQAISGWDTAVVVSGVVGQNVETSQEFELRREQTLALNSVNANASILAAVRNVPAVLDAYVIDNPSNAPATIGGVLIPANGLYVAVTGGAAAAIAQAIWSKKPPGIPLYAGNNSQVVQDTNPAYSPPYPNYTITWETPAALPVYFAIVIAASTQVPATAVAQVQNAIVNAFNGGGATFTGTISENLLTVSAVLQGVITVGQTISGAGVAAGTTIIGLGTGTGDIGTYAVSTNQTVASTQIVAGAATNSPIPPQARIGSAIYASQYAGVVSALGSWAAVKSIQVGSNNTAGASAVGSISGSTLTVTALTSGTLAVGQWLSGGDSAAVVMPGTQITALETGIGGTGTYAVSNPQTVAGAVFTASGTGLVLTVSYLTSGFIGINDVISGIGIPAGTKITGQTSGTVEGVGVYTTSLPTTASSATVTAGVQITAAAANQNIIAVNINQEPTIVASNISVTVS